MRGVGGRVLIDTDVLIYATLADDPRSERSRDLLVAANEETERYTSVQNYNAQLAATMIVHGIRTLVTGNVNDFRDMTEIRAISPFAE